MPTSVIVEPLPRWVFFAKGLTLAGLSGRPAVFLAGFAGIFRVIGRQNRWPARCKRWAWPSHKTQRSWIQAGRPRGRAVHLVFAASPAG